MKLVNVEEMRQIEQATDAEGQSYEAMMDKAGLWVATVARTFNYPDAPQQVLLLIGPGNNGGDGLVAAHYLRQQDIAVTLYIWKRDPKGDRNLSRLKRRRRDVTILWSDNDADFEKLREAVRNADVVIDALLGTGVARPLSGRLAELLAVVKDELAALAELDKAELLPDPHIPRAPLAEAYGAPPPLPVRSRGLGPTPPIVASSTQLSKGDPFNYNDATPGGGMFPFGGADDDLEDWDDEDDPFANENFGDVLQVLGVPVLAVDCPTGLNCDTGELDPAALPANITVTFAFPKWGQLQYPGAGACGLLLVTDIGVSPLLGGDLPVELIERKEARAWLPQRPKDANKGTFGKALVVGGSLSYPGAAALSATAAAHGGAGLVTLAVPRELQPILAGSLFEITWLPLASNDGAHAAGGVDRLVERLKGYDALLVGPGMTTEESAGQFLAALLPHLTGAETPWQGRAIFDADALNLLSARPNWPALLPPLSILTPHPGEMSRLTGLSIAEINGSRIATARRYAQEWGHIVLLKGAHTVVAHPDGRATVLPWAEPALAKAGSGDILAGAILAMLAQGLDPFRAAILGGFVHGLAGVMAASLEGPAGVSARELLTYLPRALRDLQQSA